MAAIAVRRLQPGDRPRTFNEPASHLYYLMVINRKLRASRAPSGQGQHEWSEDFWDCLGTLAPDFTRPETLEEEEREPLDG